MNIKHIATLTKGYYGPMSHKLIDESATLAENNQELATLFQLWGMDYHSPYASALETRERIKREIDDLTDDAFGDNGSYG